MRVIQYKISFSTQTLKRLGSYALVLFVIISLGTIAWLINYNYENRLSFTWKITLTLFSYLTLIIFYLYTRQKYLDNIVNNFVGKLGENKVAKILEQRLDNSYTYIRNYKIPDKGGDIDGILIGQKEVLIIEIKFYSGSFEINDGIFYKQSKKGQYRTWYNPIKQVEKQKRYLQHLFYENSIDAHIRAIVVLANGHIKAISGSTGIFVLEKNKLTDFINNETTSFPPLTSQQIYSVINLLRPTNLYGNPPTS